MIPRLPAYPLTCFRAYKLPRLPAAICLLACCTLAAKAVPTIDQKAVMTDASGNLSGNLTVPSGKGITVATGGTLTLPSAALPIAATNGLQAALDTKAATSSLAPVAFSGNYSNLTGLPTLGTAAATNATAYDAAGSASTAQVAAIASASADATTKANAAQAYAVQRGNHTGTQSAATITGLSAVATSGNYTDLTGKPTLGGAAALNVGTSPGTVAAGDDSRITGALSAETAATTYQPLDSDLTALAANTNTGLWTITGNGTGSARTLVASSPILIGNNNGVVGNPLIGISAATTGAAGSMSAADKTKLDGIATGATANSSDATLLARANHTGTQSADTLTDGTTNKAFLATERTKLAAITGTNTGDQDLSGLLVKSANLSDLTNAATARTNLGLGTAATTASTAYDSAGAASTAQAFAIQRANHSGTQPASTITGLATVATSGNYTDLTGKPTLFDGTWGSLSGKPSFATVATSGNYTELTNKPTLGGAASLNVGTTVSTVAAGDDSRITGALSATTAATTYQPLDSELTALAANTNTGLWTITGNGTGSARTLVASSPILIGNNNGVVGNPLIGISAATTGAAGSMSAADKTKLDGIATGATANSPDATLLARANHTGTQSADTLTDGTTNKAFLATERTKLAAITGTNTGDQDLSGLLVKSANLSDLTNAATARTNLGLGTAATTASTAYDSAGAASTAQAFAIQRANHTGTQAASTISGLSTVATTGNYTDLTSRPSLATVATSGSYTDLTGKPTLATIATTGLASDLTGTLADARLSSNVPLLTGNNTFTGTIQTAPAWLLPTYSGQTISTSQNGLGWDNLGRVTLQTTVGALQFYSTGTPASPVIYWPGKISCDSIIANASNVSVDAANITGTAINTGIIANSILPPVSDWIGLEIYAGAKGVPYVADAQGPGGSNEPTDGVYFPQAVVSGQATTTAAFAGRYRTAAQVKSDLAIAANDLTATGTKDSTTYLRGDNTWATVSGGGSAKPNLRLLTANATIASTDGIIICTGSGGITLTLPAANAIALTGQQINVLNRTTGEVTLATAGSDLLEGQSTGLITTGASWSLTSDATSNWYLY